MAFNSAIPQPGDYLSQSQSDVLGNFIALSAFLDVNNTVIKFAQTTAPTVASGLSMYLDASNILRIKSASKDVSMSGGTLASNGWSAFPSGLIMLWGSVSVGGGSTSHPGSTTVTFSGTSGFPGFTSAYNSQVTGIYTPGMDKYVWTGVPSTTQLTIYNPNNTSVTAYYTVLGS